MLPALVLLLQLPTDTLRLSAAEALARAAARAPAAVAATARVGAAEARVSAARAWTDPTLSAAAENVGAARAVTGESGVAGLEGQVVLGVPIAVGGDRGAAVAGARAETRAAAATRRLADDEAREALVVGAAAAERDATLARSATAEAAALRRFAGALERRAAEGRSAGGEAARAALEASLAATAAARRDAALAGSTARLAHLLGLDAGMPVVIEAPRCTEPGGAGAAGAPAADEASPPAALELAAARADAARAAARLAAARAVPDLVPQIGVRRTAAVTGLFVGVGTELPVFGGTRAASEASRLEAEAAEAERAGAAARLAAERHAAERTLALLEAAGQRFDAAWRAALARTVGAAEARYDAGEGTLAELLDARRARLAALDDFATWRAERRAARAHLARLAGRPLDAALLCDDLPPVE
ncbi:MAG TPA: TolC family protein [Gemmatimonadales bacterium]|nr:TolC family protein [Gemmatimonadales bacterium]